MNDNIVGMGLKAIVTIIAVVGIVLTIGLVRGGNPSAYDNADIMKLGTEIAAEQGKDKTLTQAELERFIFDEGTRVKEEREAEVQGSVNTIMNFTFYVLGAVVLVLIIGTLFSILGDFKKNMVGIIGMIGFLILLFVIYTTASNEVPAQYLAYEAKELANNPDYVSVYTPGNWKMVSAALTSTFILGGIAIAMWVVGSVLKIVK